MSSGRWCSAHLVPGASLVSGFSPRSSFGLTRSTRRLQAVLPHSFSPISSTPAPRVREGGQREGGRETPRGVASVPPPLHSGKLRSELPALAEGPYLSSPLPMAAHLRELRSQSPRGSALGLVPFSERIQRLARKLPVAAQVRHFPLCVCPLPRSGGLRAAGPPPSAGPM